MIFIGTLSASFGVVALPHVLPCPAPRVQYTEGVPGPDGKIRRRKRCAPTDDSLDVKPTARSTENGDVEEIKLAKKECPIPKPGGMLGDILKLNK